MNAEWNLAAEPIDLTPTDTPEMPAALRRSFRPRRPQSTWAQGIIICLAFLLAISGILLLIARPLGYTPADMIPPIVLLATGESIVYLLIAVIAWRCGRLV